MSSSAYAVPARLDPATTVARVAAVLTLATFGLRFFLADGPAGTFAFWLTLTPPAVLAVAAALRARHLDRGIAMLGALSGLAYGAVLVYFHSLPEDSAVIPLAAGTILLLGLVGVLLTIMWLRRPRTTL